jgi:hypothetical protein
MKAVRRSAGGLGLVRMRAHLQRPASAPYRAAFAVVACITMTLQAAAAEWDCSPAARLDLPELKVTAAVRDQAPAPHCRLDGVIGEAIRFSLWLPDKWNGKFVMGGQGGFAGAVDSQALPMGALQKGYAVAGTDTGHSGNGIDSSWAHGDMEKIVDYGHAAVHRVTVASKFLVERHFKRPTARSYFAGCSNGGRQGLMSAQRYPADFDGVIAGAPAIDFTAIAAGFLNATRLTYPDPRDHANAVLSHQERDMIGAAALAACDAKDGIADRIISDPAACVVDLQPLACRGKDSDQCLSKQEIAAAKSIYEGPRSAGRSYGYGYPVGGEPLGLGWGAWLIGAKDLIAPGVPSLAFAYGVGFMRDFVQQDRNWTYTDVEFAEMAERARLVQATLSPTSPDLSAFRARGGKLLMFHGWADSGLSPFMSIAYVDRVLAADPAAADDVRLFLLPGVLHCGGGPGPDRVDYLDALDAWVSSGRAPDALIAAFADGGGARKICPHPKKQRFLGGDGKQPSQFECR